MRVRISQGLRQSTPNLDSLPRLLQSRFALSRSHHIEVVRDGVRGHGGVSGISIVDSDVHEKIVRIDAEGFELMSRSHGVQGDELVAYVEAEDLGGTRWGTMRSEASLPQLPSTVSVQPIPEAQFGEVGAVGIWKGHPISSRS